MKQLKTSVVLMILLSMAVTCGDKYQTARTTLAFVALGAEAARGAFTIAADQKREECLKLHKDKASSEYVKCYADMAKKMELFYKIRPRIELAIANAAKYIRAAESGQAYDYAMAVKQSVCLLTEVARIVPSESWKRKIESFLLLAGAYACDRKPEPSTTSSQDDYELLVRAHKLLSEITG
jgi:hypothetical protein